MIDDKYIFRTMKYGAVLSFMFLMLTTAWSMGYNYQGQQLKPKLKQLSDRLYAKTDSLQKIKQKLQWYTDGPPPPHKMSAETIWFARVLYSETNRRREMVVLSWSVRNRVNTCFRGECSYKSVATDPWQYSGLHPRHPDYNRNIIQPSSLDPNWRIALKVAWSVKHAPEVMNLFDEEARHFWSPSAMPGTPNWALGKGRQVLFRSEPMENIPRTSRFIVYTGISSSS